VADRSAIEWTTATWNPTTGCDRISPGCDNCYVLALAGRLKAMGQPKYQNDGDARTSGPGFAVTVHPDALQIPGSWRGAAAGVRRFGVGLFWRGSDLELCYLRWSVSCLLQLDVRDRCRARAAGVALSLAAWTRPLIRLGSEAR
jgi:hypothetical protein